jgi:hypothetical protein
MIKRIILTEEEYAEVDQFARERNLNPKEAILAFVRAGNRVSSSKVKGQEPARHPKTSESSIELN